MPGLRFLIPDMLRHFRLRAQPSNVFLTYVSDSRIIGLLPVNLTAQTIPTTYVLLQAGLNNGGIIYVGMQNVSTAIGIELDAGRAIAFSSPEFAALQHGQIAGSLGAGMMRYLDGQGPEVQTQFTEAMTGKYPKVVLNLRDIMLVADLADQSLRFIYCLPLGVL